MPLKFRCYRCNQLLGISRSKIGGTISCPKCGTALVVPEPEPSVPAVTASATASSSGISPALGGSTDSILDIRPEDIRAEPGATLPPPPDETDGAPASSSEYAVESVDNERDEPIAAEEAPLVAVAPRVVPAESASLALTPEPVPPIRVATGTTIRESEGAARTRSRDVVLPRSVVLLWSLFVLVAMAMSFAAGLLSGHYIWRVHEPMARANAVPKGR